MVAQLNVTDLLQYTHTAWVENWKGTTFSFILHYQEQIRLYDQLQPPDKQTSDHAKMIYLQKCSLCDWGAEVGTNYWQSTSSG
jgi:hypothetical protein